MNNIPKTAKYEWKSIGVYGCYGLPDAHQDANNPDNYIITWQRYAHRPAEHQVEDVKFATYNARTKTFSEERYVFEPREMTIMQGHPCWEYSQGKYRLFYCQKSDKGDFIAEVTADNWSDFQKYVVSNNEPVVTPDLGGRPHMVFLPVDDSTAWLFYLSWRSTDTLSYTIFHEDSGWDKITHPIPTSTLVGSGKHTMGSALKEGGDIVLYSHVGSGENTGNAYRFKTGDRGKTWTVEQLSVSGIAEAFKRNIDGQLFTRVVRKTARIICPVRAMRLIDGLPEATMASISNWWRTLERNGHLGMQWPTSRERATYC